MKKRSAVVVAIFLAVPLLAADKPKVPAMPAAVANNAVAAVHGGLDVYSFMGVGPKKTWDDITNQVFVLHISSAKWGTVRPVPGVGGRLGASAVATKHQIFVLGGFLVDKEGNEFIVPDVNDYLPDEHRWFRAADIPVAVDSAVAGLNHDRYIYLIGGRSKTGPVNNVQVYDIQKNTWSQATPFPGAPVFGHAGGLGDDAIVVVDGAKTNASGSGAAYVPSDECWMGKIDHKDPNKVVWSKLPPHPGDARFGIVAGAREKDRWILFSGGSPKVHNFKGLDAEGKPVQVSSLTFGFDVKNNRWETVDEDTTDPRSDTRGIVTTPVGDMIVGGLVSNAAVTSRAVIIPKK
jgi:N-acetylneuraminic acid mutarotase